MVEITTIGSWRELDDAVTAATASRSPNHSHSPLVFRGLARGDYTNATSLARLEGDYADLERHLLRNFRKYAHREAPGPTTWDWLSLGQHHGLPTRLLDWTFSPQVALHFATASWPDDDAVVWAVDCQAAHRMLPRRLGDVLDREGSLVFTTELLASVARDLEALDALGDDGEPFALFFEPPSLDERIINQAAVLSVMSSATASMVEWLDEHPELAHAWCLPATVKAEVRERLDQAHVTERVLLPGLDGLAAWLRRYYSPRGAVADPREEGGASMDGSDAAAQREGAMAG